MKRIALAVAVSALTFLGTPSLAQADAGPETTAGYTLAVDGSTVQVTSFGGHCSADLPMLRQDVATKQVVRLADYCRRSASDWYVDECVPKGDYLYGLATPLECCEGCAATRYYGVAHVTTDPPSGCARTAGNAAPTPYAAGAPWPAYDPNAAPADVCGAAKADGEGGGCGIHDDASGASVSLQLFAAVAGLWLLGRRRLAG